MAKILNCKLTLVEQTMYFVKSIIFLIFFLKRYKIKLYFFRPKLNLVIGTNKLFFSVSIIFAQYHSVTFFYNLLDDPLQKVRVWFFFINYFTKYLTPSFHYGRNIFYLCSVHFLSRRGAPNLPHTTIVINKS